jgi:hypothetical protein
MSVAIEEAISNHNKVLVSVLEQLKEVNSKYACVNPEDVRNSYDTMHGIIEKKTTEINERKDYIKKCIKDLEKCNEPIAEMEKVLKKIGKTSNRGRVGTLFALCKQTIKENEIPMDEIEKMVSDFPYYEKNEIEKSKKSASRGGKRNNTKRKSYRAKNGNNKSK